MKQSIGVSSPVLRFLRTTVVSSSSPSKRSTTVLCINSIFGFASAAAFATSLQSITPSSWMIETFTFFANFVRNIPSSIAASPEPITRTSSSVHAAASHVAQNAIPFPMYSSSFSAPVSLGLLPLAIITDFASYLFLNVSTIFIHLTNQRS